MSYIAGLLGLEGKVVVITGATGQIGKRLVTEFLKCGCTVVGLDVKLESNILAGATYQELDVRDGDQFEACLRRIFERHGKIDVLINNAGVSTFEPFEKRAEDLFDWVSDVNLKGTFFGIQKYVNLCDEFNQTGGAIINTASMYGVISPDFRIYDQGDRKNSEVYGATKAGVIQMTRYFAVHLADRGIRVNAVSPGGIFNPETPQADNFIDKYSFRCPMKRMGNDEEMFGAFMYLASDLSTYTNGVNLVVDGGMNCW